MKTNKRLKAFREFMSDWYGVSIDVAHDGRILAPALWQDWRDLQSAIDNQAYAIFRAHPSYAKRLGLL
jgi:hypothetical protein